ncbi:hypothetical protein [Nocardiopsis oceani]
MKLDRTDTLVAVCFAITATATVGMFFDVWHLVYYAIPALITLLMLIGSLNMRHEWSATVVVSLLSFGAVLTLLFAAAHATLHGSGYWGGLPTSSALVFYAIWPFTTVVGPLLFTLVYQKWIRHDFEESQPESAQS